MLARGHEVVAAVSVVRDECGEFCARRRRQFLVGSLRIDGGGRLHFVTGAEVYVDVNVLLGYARAGFAVGRGARGPRIDDGTSKAVANEYPARWVRGRRGHRGALAVGRGGPRRAVDGRR